MTHATVKGGFGFWQRACLHYQAALEREQEMSKRLMDALDRCHEEHDRLVARLKELEGEVRS